MKNKFKILITFSLFVLLLSGCGRKETLNNVISDKTELSVYSIAEDKTKIVKNEIKVDKITNDEINTQLHNSGVLKDDINAEKVFKKNNDSKLLQINYSNNFVEYIKSLSKEDEYLTITCIANTYLEAYDYDQVVITNNGESFKSNNIDYSKYIKFNDDLKNPYLDKEKSETTKEENVKNEYLQVEKLFDTINENYTENDLLISPISTYGTLNILYSGSKGETKALLKKYIDDTDKIQKDYSTLVQNTDFDLSNALFYHKGGTDNKTCNSTFAKNVENYKTEIYSTNMNLQNTSLETFNKWVSGKTKNKITNFMTAVSNTTQLYPISINQFDILFNSYPVQSTFTTSDDQTLTKTFINLQGDKTIFDDDNITVVSSNINNNNYKLVCIMPNKTTKLSDINLSNIITKSEKTDKEIYIPIINNISNLKLQKSLSSDLNLIFTNNADFSNMFDNTTSSFGVSEIGQINLLTIDSQYKLATENVESIENTENSTENNINENSVIFNKSFYYLIIDNSTDEVIFIGEYTK